MAGETIVCSCEISITRALLRHYNLINIVDTVNAADQAQTGSYVYYLFLEAGATNLM